MENKCVMPARPPIFEDEEKNGCLTKIIDLLKYIKLKLFDEK